MTLRIACAFLLWAVASMAHAQDKAKSAGSAEAIRAAPATPKIAGVLAQNPIWKSYRSRFVTEAGRVVDTANSQISHSEGQGYGMLLAVAAMDRDAFDRIWGWTRANLMVRDDELVDELPAEPHDVAMTHVITPRHGIIAIPCGHLGE